MKKFVSLCAFVAALSFVSCGGNTASGSADSLGAALEAAVETAGDAIDSVATQAGEAVENVAEAIDSVAAEAGEALN